MNLSLAELVAQQPCQKPQATPLPMSREGAWLAAVPSPHPLAGTWLLLFFFFHHVPRITPFAQATQSGSR